MAHKIIMPKQGLMMTEGTIINWLVNEGETVTAGKPLFEMETDKLTITIDTLETALLWLRRMVEDALSDEEK